MTVQWGIGTGNNALGMFQYGAQLGQNMQDRRDQREDRNALIALRERQEDRLAQQQQNEQAKAQQGERRANMGDVAKLFDGVTPENYGQRVALAQQMGVDVSGVPQQFDPAWVQQQQTVLRFFQERPDAISTAGKQAMDAGFQPGTPEFQQAVRGIIEASLAQPYTGGQGETRLYTPGVFGGGQPAAQAGPQPGAVEDGYRFNGGNAADPNNWSPIAQGGPTQPASGGFRP
jgi:hypothetical protein